MSLIKAPWRVWFDKDALVNTPSDLFVNGRYECLVIIFCDFFLKKAWFKPSNGYYNLRQNTVLFNSMELIDISICAKIYQIIVYKNIKRYKSIKGIKRYKNIFKDYMFSLMCLLFHLILVVSCFKADIIPNECFDRNNSAGWVT